MIENKTQFSRIRTNIKIILLSIICLLVSILILEIVLRTTHLFNANTAYSEPDLLLGFRLTPNSSYWRNKENDHPIIGKINSFGWRDKERSIAKPDGTYRIAIIGDSFVEAFQVELNSTFVALAENQLKKDINPKIELMSFGRSGMTQTEELLVLKNNVSPFSPDFVILFFLPANDISDVNRKTAFTELRPFYEILENGSLMLDTSFNKSREYKFKTFINPIKQHSALISLLAERYNTIQSLRRKKISSPKESKNKIKAWLSLGTANPDPTYLNNYRLNKILIKEMAKYCKKRKIKFMLVSIASIYKPEDIVKYRSIDPTFNEDFFDYDLKKYATSIGVEYLGLQNSFKEFYKREKKSLNWVHWNYLGHSLVAKVLSQKLKTILSKEGLK